MYVLLFAALVSWDKVEIFFPSTEDLMGAESVFQSVYITLKNKSIIKRDVRVSPASR